MFIQVGESTGKKLQMMSIESKNILKAIKEMVAAKYPNSSFAKKQERILKRSQKNCW